MSDATTTTRSALGAGFLGAAAPWLAAIAVLLVLPQILTSNSTITIMNQMAITIIFALAYNMLLGQGGMLSFGHAVYMGLGGFFCVHLINAVEYDGLWLPLPILPLFGGLFGLIFAMLVGSFSTRRAGTVFAMISLGVGELIAASSIIVVAFFGGEEGVSGDRTMGPPVLGVEFLQQKEVYYLVAFWLIVAALLMYLFSRTPVGRMANAVRDNPERAEFLGYSARKVRFYSFCASGFFAGIAGGLFAINYEILTEENLNLATSGRILLVTFLGGVGYFIGPIVGAIVFTLLLTVLGLETDLWAMYVGGLFLVTVMFFPSGLTGLLAIHAVPFRLGKLPLLVGPYLKTLVPGVIGVLGFAGLMEIVFHVRHAAIGDTEMSIFWTTFDTHSVLPWIVTGGVGLGEILIARRFAPEMKRAWDLANTPDKIKGGAS